MTTMTIKELSNALGVSKPTVSKAIETLGIQADLQKIGNRYILSESQAEAVKTQITQICEMEKSEISQEIKNEKTQKTENKSKILQNETEKSLISLLEKQITILQEQLIVKDNQINALTTSLQNTTAILTSTQEALTAAQALHAGTLQGQLTTKASVCEDDVNMGEQEKKGFWKKIFKRKNRKVL